MSDEAPKMTPTERIYSLGMAALTKPPRPSSRVESISYKQVATGALAGHLIIDDLTLSRDEDETLDEWTERQHFMLDYAHRQVAQWNADHPTNGKP